MNAQSARQCPRCKAPAGAQARFCTGCGASLQFPACGTCGQGLSEGARFCTVCGAPASPTAGGAEQTALASTIAALELSLYRGDPRRVLQASLDAFAKSPNTEEGVIASVTAMSAYAQLGDFEQAQACLLRARGLFAIHLGLTEPQQARFVKDPFLIDDLREAGDRSLRETPWLYFIMGHSYGPYLPGSYKGESEAEKRRTAMETWAGFVGGDQGRFAGALAFLYFSNRQYKEAAKHFENVLLMARRYESVSPLRIELVWPLVTLGNSYWEGNEPARAAACWQRARSVAMCAESGASADDWSLLAMPWIEQAKAQLAERRMVIPPPDISRQSSDHLRAAIQYQLEAEQFEAKDAGLEDLVDRVRQAGRRYTAPLERANSELENMKKLDPFAWAPTPIKDSSYWWRYESAKGLLLLKTSFVHLASEKLALAVASCKQSMDFWPSLTTGAMLGGLQAICGLKSDARATYSMCLRGAEELGFDQSSSDREQALAEIREALSQPSLLVER